MQAVTVHGYYTRCASIQILCISKEHKQLLTQQVFSGMIPLLILKISIPIPMYKLTRGLIDIDTRKYLIQHSKSRTRGSHHFKFHMPYAKFNKDVCKFSFFPKTLIDWNCLPEAIVSSSSLETFTYRLTAFPK